MKRLNIVIFGLSITSSWGNGHATTFRALVKALARRGHDITFFERDVSWYAANRDLPNSSYCQIVLYNNLAELQQYRALLHRADLVILGSYVKDAHLLAEWINEQSPPCFAFYDIDTPVTLAKLARGDYEYLHPSMIPRFDIYLSFTGGPTLKKLEQEYRARRARPLYCSVDTEHYFPEMNGPGIKNPEIKRPAEKNPSENNPATGYPATDSKMAYALGYLGTYSDDRQPTLDRLLIQSAKQAPNLQFCLAGAQYPESIQWPENIELTEHIPPARHREFYTAQRFTLNVTRQDMIKAGYAPSVRLFEAAACGTPVISDNWPGLDSFFDIGKEILIARDHKDVLQYLQMNEADRQQLSTQLRDKVLHHHTSMHRARSLEQYWQEATSTMLVANHAH